VPAQEAPQDASVGRAGSAGASPDAGSERRDAGQTGEPRAGSMAQAPTRDAGPPARDAGPPARDAASEADAGEDEPAPDVASSCPVRITLNTRTYGTGDELQDDYAPRNVGAIWISSLDGDRFVRTVAAWGPMYFDHALMWIDHSEGSLVDAVTLPTRSSHARPVEATWDCRDHEQQLVAAGGYRVNIEFTEAEVQGPALTRERAPIVQLGAGATEIVRAPQSFFGEIRITSGKP